MPGGRLSLQSITFPDAAYQAQLRGVNWIQQYIFPGGLLPSLAAIERAIGRTRPADHGASRHRRALRHRRSGRGARRFLEQLDAVRAMGFDDRFVRMWEYYLAISEAGFSTGMTQDLQIAFQKGRGRG